jgi:hypothetical protein
VDVHGLLAFSPGRDLKFYFFIFLKGFETLSADGGMVDKQVVPAFAADKPKSFTLIEPFHSTFYHLLSPFRFWFAKWPRSEQKSRKKLPELLRLSLSNLNLFATCYLYYPPG